MNINGQIIKTFVYILVVENYGDLKIYCFNVLFCFLKTLFHFLKINICCDIYDLNIDF